MVILSGVVNLFRKKFKNPTFIFSAFVIMYLLFCDCGIEVVAESLLTGLVIRQMRLSKRNNLTGR